MASKTIEFKYKIVDESGNVIEQTTSKLGVLESKLQELKNNSKNLDIGSQAFKNNQQAIDATEKALGKAQLKTESLGASLQKIPGPVGQLAQGFTGMGKAAMAFVANPIGAVVAALGVVFAAVTKAIKNSEAAMDSITKITAIFGGIVRPIFEFLETVAVAALDAVASGLEKVSSLFGSAGAAAGNYADALDAAEDTEKDLAVTRAETNKQLAESREILSDTNASYEARVAALNKIKAAESAQSKQEIDNKKELLRLAELDLQLNGASEEAIQKVRDAKIALAQAEQDGAAKQRLFNREQKKLDAEAEAKRKQVAEDERKRQEEYLANRKAAAEAIRKLDEDNTLNAIKNEEDRDKKAQEFAYARQVREINAMKLTDAEKKTLMEEAAEANRLAVQKINDKYDEEDKKKDEEKAKAAKELADRTAEALADTEQERRDLALSKKKEEFDTLIEETKKAGGDTKELVKAQEQAIQDLKDGFADEDFAKKQAEYEKIYSDETLSYEQRLEALKAFNQATTDATNLTEEEKTAIIKKNAQTQQEIELAAAQARVDITNGYLDAAAQAGQLLQQIAGENKKVAIAGVVVEQASAIGKIIANTSIANAKSVAASPLTVGQPWVTINTISAGLSIASSIAAAAKAISEINAADSKAGGGGGAGNVKPVASKFEQGGLLTGRRHAQGGIVTPMGEMEGGEFVINRQSTASFLPLLESINSLGNSTSNVSSAIENSMLMSQPTITKTYVVATDVSSQQEANKRISDLARL